MNKPIYYEDEIIHSDNEVSEEESDDEMTLEERNIIFSKINKPESINLEHLINKNKHKQKQNKKKQNKQEQNKINLFELNTKNNFKKFNPRPLPPNWEEQYYLKNGINIFKEDKYFPSLGEVFKK